MVDKLDIMTGKEAASLLGVSSARIVELSGQGLIRRLARGVYDAQSVLTYKQYRDKKEKAGKYVSDLPRYNNGQL